MLSYYYSVFYVFLHYFQWCLVWVRRKRFDFKRIGCSVFPFGSYQMGIVGIMGMMGMMGYDEL